MELILGKKVFISKVFIGKELILVNEEKRSLISKIILLNI